ncbi:hypothetical protein L249_5854 [Ophiocordyceps polyrhachis-furcata BCC 54312]|uniref:Mid2 domain-containing protein n=1 Tax=Ophiocordyceps polyrhachis-furcata BCC 54312 TaxID=1330021 RepID=A0A367L0D0_9HYPO|nr:hypothetical protein L249_5854 [Ophiocordyceps polyrhachis-furcata BCC 54312]
MASNSPEPAPDCPPDETSCPDARPPRTDSGITHTVPNHSVVTVTRHTVIFSEAPSSSTTTAAAAEDTVTTLQQGANVRSSTLSSAPTAGVASSSEGRGGNGASSSSSSSSSVSSGLVVGLVVAGCFVVGIGLLLGFFVLCRRRRRRRRRLLQLQPAADDFHHHGLEPTTGEKEHQPMSAHTTGTQASGTDPFAPFGGRADQTPDDDIALEMDGATMAPVELPAEPAAMSVRPVTPNHHYKPSRNAPAAVDPRAILNSKTESGHGAYVNQWSNWRVLGGAIPPPPPAAAAAAAAAGEADEAS